MKKILILSATLLFWGSCKTTPTYNTVPFETFEIRKIVDHGLQPVVIRSSQKEWPEVTFKELTPLKFDSKKIKVAVIGDTGCRLSEARGKVDYQNCNLSDEWPFAEIIQSVVKETYDFAIHTGDYHYREQCTDKKLCPGYTKSVGYGWNTWWDDFYGPAQLLFKKSPVLLVRGNHEDCYRAHAGWGPISAYNKKFADKCDEIEPYQWIEIGDLVFINFDDSAFQDRKASPEEKRQEWLKVMRGLSQRITELKTKKEIWFMAHKPVLGFIPTRNLEDDPFSIADYLKVLLRESGLAEKIDYFLAGHIHNQQLVLSEKDMLQIVVGNSGSSLDPFGRKIMNDKMISTTVTDRSFGYALFERQGFKNWKFLFKNVKGETDLVCTVKARKISCRE